MVSELITVYGETDGSSTSGTFSLNSPLFHSPVTEIRIPKGMKAKIWCKRISGEAVTVLLRMTRDITASSPTWITIDVQVLPSKGELELEKRRPIIIEGITGKEAIRLEWSQTTAGKSYIAYELEITDE